MAKEKWVTRSRTGCMPAAKRKKTDFLNYIVSIAEKTVENQLTENHPPDPMLSFIKRHFLFGMVSTASIALLLESVSVRLPLMVLVGVK